MNKKIKLFLVIIFMFCIISCVNSFEVYAVETLNDFNTAPGELIIPFQKIWHENVSENEKVPITITLYKYLGDTFNINDTTNTKAIETVTLNGEESSSWQYNFDISKESLIDSNGNHYKFKFIEQMPQGYMEVERKEPTVTFSPPNTAEDYQILSSNSLTNIPLEKIGASTGTIVAATMTSEDKDKFICGVTGDQQCDIIIWTQDALSPAERVLIARFVNKTTANFKKAIYELNEDGTIKANTVYFISGNGTLGGMSVGKDIDEIEKVMFSNTSKWSHVLVGVYNKSQASSIGASITNDVSKISLTVKKEWNDHNNILELRPLNITIELLKNGEVVNEVILSESNSWTHTFNGLLEYSNGKLNDYDVRELNINGYVSSNKIEENTIIITNTHEVKSTEITVNKVWNNIEQLEKLPGVIVALYYKKSEKEQFREISRIILNEENNWTYTFKDGKDIITNKIYDILPSNYIYDVKEIGFDITDEYEKSFYEEFFITDYSHTDNSWIITNTCTASYILPETGSSKTLILAMVTIFLLGTPIIYLIYSFIKKDV